MHGWSECLRFTDTEDCVQGGIPSPPKFTVLTSQLDTTVLSKVYEVYKNRIMEDSLPFHPFAYKNK